MGGQLWCALRVLKKRHGLCRTSITRTWRILHRLYECASQLKSRLAATVKPPLGRGTANQDHTVVKRLPALAKVVQKPSAVATLMCCLKASYKRSCCQVLGGSLMRIASTS